jgi:TolB-like protein
MGLLRAEATLAATAAVLALLAPACGYRLAGANTFLPPHIQVIVVVPFENRTSRPEIEQRVTEEVARELSKRGRYKLVTDRTTADAILDGAVVGYRTTAVEFDADGRATRIEAMVTLQATLRERAIDEILWSQDGLVFREQFDVKSTSQENVFLEEESVALDEIARGAAGLLVNSILEGF